jgi:hypothetical protein
MAIRIPVTVVIEMDDDQQAHFAHEAAVGVRPDERPYVRDIETAVRGAVLGAVIESPWFAKRGNGSGGARVTLQPECPRCGSTEHDRCYAAPVEYPGYDLPAPDASGED